MSVTSMQEARRSRGRRTAAAVSVDLGAFVTSWQLSLEAAAKSPRTVRSYTDSVRALQKFLVAQGMTADVEEVDAVPIDVGAPPDLAARHQGLDARGQGELVVEHEEVDRVGVRGLERGGERGHVAGDAAVAVVDALGA